jgi:hypothetical protein
MLTISYITISVINTTGMSNLKIVICYTTTIHTILRFNLILKPLRYAANIRCSFTIQQAESKASAFSEVIICN